MDGVPDKDDSMPLKKGLKPFGTPEYENEVNSKAETLYNDTLKSSTLSTYPIRNDLPLEYSNHSAVGTLLQVTVNFEKEKAISKAAINIMMEDVNKCEDYLQYISDED